MLSTFGGYANAMIHFFATHFAFDVFAVWLALLLLCCAFISGAALMHDDTETWGTLDAEPSELCKVLAFPSLPREYLEPVPEFRPITNGVENGWVS
jgi:hypothetical protein